MISKNDRLICSVLSTIVLLIVYLLLVLIVFLEPN